MGTRRHRDRRRTARLRGSLRRRRCPRRPTDRLTDGRNVRCRVATDRGTPRCRQRRRLVWACHLLGYQKPDLTLHPAQVRDWYASEDGLDLRALDADRAALTAAAAATESARQLQERPARRAGWCLAGPWRRRLTRIPAAARRRIGRRGHAVRTAVDALTALRDNLWHDGRREGRRRRGYRRPPAGTSAPTGWPRRRPSPPGRVIVRWPAS